MVCDVDPDGTIILWEPTADRKGLEEDQENLESWRAAVILRGASSEIYDLAWSADGTYLASACVDNTVRIFNVKERILG